MNYNLYLATYIVYFMVVHGVSDDRARDLARSLWNDFAIEDKGVPEVWIIDEWFTHQKISWQFIKTYSTI